MSTEYFSFLDLILKDSIHLNFSDFTYCETSMFKIALCVAIQLANNRKDVHNLFIRRQKFKTLYEEIYFKAIEDYRSFVGCNDSIPYETDVLVNYNGSIKMIKYDNVLENEKIFAKLSFDIASTKSFGIIIRDESVIWFTNYHSEKFIVINPDYEYSGIITLSSLLSYVTCDKTWKGEVTFISGTENDVPRGNPCFKPTDLDFTDIDDVINGNYCAP